MRDAVLQVACHLHTPMLLCKPACMLLCTYVCCQSSCSGTSEQRLTALALMQVSHLRSERDLLSDVSHPGVVRLLGSFQVVCHLARLVSRPCAADTAAHDKGSCGGYMQNTSPCMSLWSAHTDMRSLEFGSCKSMSVFANKLCVDPLKTPSCQHTSVLSTSGRSTCTSQGDASLLR
jgi:hypothetical protein